MSNIKFLREPGRICDLFNIFILHFNKNLWLSNFVNISKTKSDTEFYNTVLNQFPNIPDELMIFFYMKNDSKSFLFYHYLLELYSKERNDYHFETVKEDISNVEEFTNRLFEFYFPEQKKEMDFSKKPCIPSQAMDKISDLVSESNYTSIIKFYLLIFFVDPEKYIKKLLHELIAKEALLNLYYEKHYTKAIEVQEKFDFEWLTQKMKDINGKSSDFSEFENFYVTICLIAKNIISFILSSEIVFLGFDYEDGINMLLSRKNQLALDSFGKILSEKNRIEILEMLLNAEELTTSEIAKKLDISVNAAFYHLDMMVQGNMLLLRNEGRTVIYRINKGYFKDAQNLIARYEK